MAPAFLLARFNRTPAPWREDDACVCGEEVSQDTRGGVSALQAQAALLRGAPALRGVATHFVGARVNILGGDAMARMGRQMPRLARPTARLSAWAASGCVVVSTWPWNAFMEALFASIGLVALAEIGDKTQLLAILLAATFKKPWPIIAGILCATIANHLAAAALGYLLSDFVRGFWFQIAIAIGFIAMGAWALIPDKADDNLAAKQAGGVFLTTLVAFFLVEIGDKTQIATSLLAARYHAIVIVAIGTTIGMMIANVPAVLLGEAAAKIVPLRYVRWGAALVFVVLGIVTLIAALAR